MDEDEKDMLQQEGTENVIDFEEHLERTEKDQVARIMNIKELQKNRNDKAQFIKKAIMNESYLEPFFLMQEYDRIKKAKRSDGTNPPSVAH